MSVFHVPVLSGLGHLLVLFTGAVFGNTAPVMIGHLSCRAILSGPEGVLSWQVPLYSLRQYTCVFGE